MTLKNLNDFPKNRPPLPENYLSIYEKEYMINRERRSLAGKLSEAAESWMHRQVSSIPGKNILEIGAGTLNHVGYEAYTKYDFIEPFKGAYENSKNLKLVNTCYESIDDVPVNNKYDKIFSVAVLEHLENLPSVVAKSALLLTEDGVFLNAIPSEGGFLWYLGLYLTTGIGFRLRNKLSLKPVMEHEHLNDAHEIIEIVRYFFKDVRIKRFPFPFLHGSLYTYIEARNLNYEQVTSYLKKIG